MEAVINLLLLKFCFGGQKELKRLGGGWGASLGLTVPWRLTSPLGHPHQI